MGVLVNKHPSMLSILGPLSLGNFRINVRMYIVHIWANVSLVSTTPCTHINKFCMHLHMDTDMHEYLYTHTDALTCTYSGSTPAYVSTSICT